MKGDVDRATTHELERRGARPVRFEGELVGEASSWVSGARRWTEVRIYALSGGRWVAETVGRSVVLGECDFPDAEVCAGIEPLIEFLMSGEDGYLGRVSRAALESAGIDAAEEV